MGLQEREDFTQLLNFLLLIFIDSDIYLGYILPNIAS